MLPAPRNRELQRMAVEARGQGDTRKDWVLQWHLWRLWRLALHLGFVAGSRFGSYSYGDGHLYGQLESGHDIP